MCPCCVGRPGDKTHGGRVASTRVLGHLVRRPSVLKVTREQALAAEGSGADGGVGLSWGLRGPGEEGPPFL